MLLIYLIKLISRHGCWFHLPRARSPAPLHRPQRDKIRPPQGKAAAAAAAAAAAQALPIRRPEPPVARATPKSATPKSATPNQVSHTQVSHTQVSHTHESATRAESRVPRHRDRRIHHRPASITDWRASTAARRIHHRQPARSAGRQRPGQDSPPREALSSTARAGTAARCGNQPGARVSGPARLARSAVPTRAAASRPPLTGPAPCGVLLCAHKATCAMRTDTLHTHTRTHTHTHTKH